MSLSPTSKIFQSRPLERKEKHSVTFLREQRNSSCSGTARIGVTHLQGCREQAEIQVTALRYLGWRHCCSAWEAVNGNMKVSVSSGDHWDRLGQ